MPLAVFSIPLLDLVSLVVIMHSRISRPGFPSAIQGAPYDQIQDLSMLAIDSTANHAFSLIKQDSGILPVV